MTTSSSFSEILFQNSFKVYIGIENNKFIIKTDNNHKLELDLDLITLPYLFQTCLSKIKNFSSASSSIENKKTIGVSQKKVVVATKKILTYDNVFEILEHKNKTNPTTVYLDLTDEEWREILLESFRTRKTYAGGIIKNLQDMGLPIEDVQIGRVLKKMREEGFIRGTQKKSQKTGNLYYLLEFPPYKED